MLFKKLLLTALPTVLQSLTQNLLMLDCVCVVKLYLLITSFPKIFRILIPLYDQDTNMVFLAGKGDRNIQFVEVKCLMQGLMINWLKCRAWSSATWHAIFLDSTLIGYILLPSWGSGSLSDSLDTLNQKYLNSSSGGPLYYKRPSRTSKWIGIDR